MSTDSNYEAKQKQFFARLLAEPANNLCADCNSKSPRWASWNLGAFICIRCSGIHRKLGVHLTKVKSVTLDKWTEEQLQSMANGGNAKVNQLYNPSNVQVDPIALTSGAEADRKLEQYIRDKYEFKRFMSGATSNSYPSQTQQKPATNLSQQQYFPYNNELKQLVGMGFEESLVREALSKNNGGIQASVEYIVSNRRPSVSAAPPTTQQTSPREYFKDAPRMLSKEVSSTGQVLNQGTSPLLKQLHNMGFTDDSLNMAAINEANGSLELAVEMLAEGKVKQTKGLKQVQQNNASPPKQDLLDLFDTPQIQNQSDQNDFGDFQATNQSPSNVSSNAQKKMNPNDILGLFDNSPPKQFQTNQQYQSQSLPQQQFGQFQQSPPQQQFQQSPPQQQFGQFQQSPPQQQFGQYQQPQPFQSQQPQTNPFQQSTPQQPTNNFQSPQTNFQQRLNSPPQTQNPFSQQQNQTQFQNNPFGSQQSSNVSSNYIAQVLLTYLAFSAEYF
eukprot:NODE_1129_length_2075_cov_1.134109.p1 type:complete len:499 gc:universal NODE_1129_length_2075_cov_1.134109:1520-24(-)